MRAARFSVDEDRRSSAAVRTRQAAPAASVPWVERPQAYGQPPSDAVTKACAELQWLVRREARRLARRLPNFADVDDLVGAGFIGLVMAVQRHIDQPMEILQRVALQRVRGAMLDHLRSNDHLTRRQRAAVGELRKHTERLTREAADTSDAALAHAMGTSTRRIDKIRSQLAAVQVTHLEDAERIPSNADDAVELLIERDAKRHLVAALGELPEKVQTLLALYYCEGLSYREIGAVLGVTDSRVCQVHGEAMSTLRRKLKHLRDG